MTLSIIIPMYNEKDTIRLVVDQLDALQYPESVKSVEIVIVDDCSSDGSVEIAADLANARDHVILVRHLVNQGKGAAVRSGIAQSSGDTLLVRDADLELSVEDIPPMILAMEELNVEFVNGSRYMAGVNRPLSSYRRFLANRFFTFLTSLIIDVKLTDMACGYKLFKRELYDRLVLRENRFGFEAEILIKSLRKQANNIAEVPVRYFPRYKDGGKKLSNRDALRILWVVFKYGLFRRK